MLEKIKVKLSKRSIIKSRLKLSYYAKYLNIDDKCTIKKIIEHLIILKINDELLPINPSLI